MTKRASKPIMQTGSIKRHSQTERVISNNIIEIVGLARVLFTNQPCQTIGVAIIILTFWFIASPFIFLIRKWYALPMMKHSDADYVRRTKLSIAAHRKEGVGNAHSKRARRA